MVKSDYKTWVQTESSSVLTCYHTVCGFIVVLTSSSSSATIFSSSSPGKRGSCLFQLGCQFAHSVDPWLPKVAHQLTLKCLWRLNTPASLPDHHENHLTYVDSSSMVSLGFLMHSLTFFGHCSLSPTFLHNYLENYVTEVDSALVVPLCFHSVFPLSSSWAFILIPIFHNPGHIWPGFFDCF